MMNLFHLFEDSYISKDKNDGFGGCINAFLGRRNSRLTGFDHCCTS